MRDGVRRILRDVWFNAVAAHSVWPQRVRGRLFTLGGASVDGAGVLAGQTIIGGSHLELGRGTFVNVGCLFDAGAPIRIGENVAIGPGARFITSTHEIGTRNQRAAKVVLRGIVVGDGVWIGAGATILPGVHVAGGVVIAAGAVVAADCLSMGVYAGVPARMVRSLD